MPKHSTSDQNHQNTICVPDGVNAFTLVDAFQAKDPTKSFIISNTSTGTTITEAKPPLLAGEMARHATLG